MSRRGGDTLRGEAVVGGEAGMTQTVKMSASCWIASSCALPREANGEAGAGLRMAQHSSMAARMAALADESWGILPK
jgi:hypothetical protein